MKGSAFMPPLDIELAERLLVGFTQFTERYPDARDSAVALEFTPFEKIVEVGQRETAFANRGPYGGILCVVGWTEKGLDEVCRAWTREMSEVCKVKFQAERGALDGVGEYCNYDGELGLESVQCCCLSFCCRFPENILLTRWCFGQVWGSRGIWRLV